MKLAFRPPSSEDDWKFVVESMLESQRTSYSAGLVPIAKWFDVMRPVFRELLERDGMRVLVAAEATDASFLYGWIAADPNDQRLEERDGSVRWWPALVLYVFVKSYYRKHGIGRALFKAIGVNLSQPFLYAANTQQASRLSAKAPSARFNPLAVRFPKEAA